MCSNFFLIRENSHLVKLNPVSKYEKKKRSPAIIECWRIKIPREKKMTHEDFFFNCSKLDSKISCFGPLKIFRDQIKKFPNEETNK